MALQFGLPIVVITRDIGRLLVVSLWSGRASRGHHAPHAMEAGRCGKPNGAGGKITGCTEIRCLGSDFCQERDRSGSSLSAGAWKANEMSPFAQFVLCHTAQARRS